MSIFLLSTDLFSSSPISGAAKQLGRDFKCVMSQQDFEDKLTESPPELVIIDLGCDKFEIQKCAEMLSSHNANIAMVAFGPHVHEQKLAAAQDAGCVGVYTKGQFLQQTSAILASHLGS